MHVIRVEDNLCLYHSESAFLAFLLQMPLNVEVANELKLLMITLILNIPMNSSIWFDMINLGWFIVYIKGSKVRIAKLRYIGLDQQNFSA